jgi:hypothetical protein
MISAYAGFGTRCTEGPEKGGTMWFALSVWLGSMGLALLLGWWVHHHQRDIDDYHTREFQAPLVFQWPGWH